MKKPTVTAMAVTPKVERTITLTMDETTAGVVMKLVGSIVGDPKTTYREHADAVWGALLGLGVKSGEDAFEDFVNIRAKAVDA